MLLGFSFVWVFGYSISFWSECVYGKEGMQSQNNGHGWSE